MDILEFCAIMLVSLLGLIVAAFAAGPYVLRWFFETLDEWEEIIDSASAKEE